MASGLMILDDITDFRKTLKSKLIKSGFSERIGLARTANEAIAKHKKCRFKVLLIDLKLTSNKTGFDALEEIRKFDTSAKAIIVSGNPALYDANKAQNLGIKHYFKKPINKDINKLIQAVDQEIKLFDEMNNMSIQKDIQDDIDFLENLASADKELWLNRSFRLKLMLAKTVQALKNNPEILTAINNVFLQEVPEMEAIVKELTELKIKKISDAYRKRMKMINTLEREIFNDE